MSLIIFAQVTAAIFVLDVISPSEKTTVDDKTFHKTFHYYQMTGTGAKNKTKTPEKRNVRDPKRKRR